MGFFDRQSYDFSGGSESLGLVTKIWLILDGINGSANIPYHHFARQCIINGSPLPLTKSGWAQDLIVTNLVCLWAQDFIEEMGGGISIGPSTASVHGNNVTSLLLSTETPETRGKAGNKPEISRRNIIQGHQN